VTATVSFSSDSVGELTQVLTLDGTSDQLTAVEAEQRIAAALDAGTRDVVFDLRGVISLDLSMLHVLFRGLMRTKMQGSRFVLIRPNAYVWELFEQSGLDKAFSTFSDLRDALAKAPVRDSHTRFQGSELVGSGGSE
jgi:anti-anti-sigma factor